MNRFHKFLIASLLTVISCFSLTANLGLDWSCFRNAEQARAATNTTLYFAFDRNKYEGSTIRANVNRKGDGDGWEKYDMLDTHNGYHGQLIYTCNFTDLYDGLGCLQFQFYEGDTHKGEDQAISSWTSSSVYNGKMWDNSTRRWIEYGDFDSIYNEDYLLIDTKNVSWWTSDSAVSAAYFFDTKSSANEWVRLQQIDYPANSTLYYGNVPLVDGVKKYNAVIFLRLKPQGSDGYDSSNDGLNWNNEWNRTVNVYNNNQKHIYEISSSTIDGSHTGSWKDISHTVTYVKGDGNTGTLPSPASFSLPIGSTFKVKAATTSAAGIQFGGWESSDGHTYAVGNSEPLLSDSDVTLSTTWAYKTYTITFSYPAGATGTLSSTVTYGGNSLNPVPVAYERTGYTFSKYVDVNGKNVIKKDGTFFAANNPYYTSSSGWKYDGDLTLYATYTASSMTIYFKNESGDSQTADEAKIYYDSTKPVVSGVEIDPVASRANYSFTGYYTSKNAGLMVFDSNGTLQSDVSGFTDSNGKWIRTGSQVTLYARYTGCIYSITLDDNGGSGGSETIYEKYGGYYWRDAACSERRMTEDYYKVTTPTRDGYNFLGYFANNDGSGNQYILDTGGLNTDVAEANYFTSDATIYAGWEAKTYNITYSPGNYSQGDSIIVSKTHGIDLTLSSSCSFIRDGRVALGWSLDPNGTTLDYAFGATFSVNADTTLYPCWNGSISIVSSDSDMGSVDLGTFDIIRVKVGDTITYLDNKLYINDVLAATAITNDPTAQYTYSFDGWTYESATVTDGMTVTAEFSSTLNSYDITWVDYNDTELRVDSLEYGSTPAYGLPPTRQGYSFAGWDPAITTVTGDATYKATYTTDTQYQVTFDVDGKCDPPSPQLIVEGGLVTKPQNPEVRGYTFDGWFKENTYKNAWNFETDTVNDNITIYGKFSAIVCAIDVETNTTETDDFTIYIKYDDERGFYPNSSCKSAQSRVTMTKPTKEHYVFDGYFTIINGVETQLSNNKGRIVAGFETLFISDAEAYAKWSPATYTVSFKKNDNLKPEGITSNITGSQSSFTVTYDPEGFATLPDTSGFSLPYCIQTGWSDGTISYNFGDHVFIDANTEFYPTWSAKTVNLNLYADEAGKTLITTVTYTNGIGATLPSSTYAVTGQIGWQYITNKGDATKETRTFYSFGQTYIRNSNDNFSMYAVLEYVITVDNHYGQSAISSFYAVYGFGYYASSGMINEISSVSVPTRTNYTFNGYYLANDTLFAGVDGLFVNPENKKIFTADSSIIAHWKVNDGYYLAGVGGFSEDTLIPYSSYDADKNQFIFNGLDLTAGTEVKLCHYKDGGLEGYHNGYIDIESYFSSIPSIYSVYLSNNNVVVGKEGTYDLYIDVYNNTNNGRYSFEPVVEITMHTESGGTVTLARYTDDLGSAVAQWRAGSYVCVPGKTITIYINGEEYAVYADLGAGNNVKNIEDGGHSIQFNSSTIADVYFKTWGDGLTLYGQFIDGYITSGDNFFIEDHGLIINGESEIAFYFFNDTTSAWARDFASVIANNDNSYLEITAPYTYDANGNPVSQNWTKFIVVRFKVGQTPGQLIDAGINPWAEDSETHIRIYAYDQSPDMYLSGHGSDRFVVATLNKPDGQPWYVTATIGNDYTKIDRANDYSAFFDEKTCEICADQGIGSHHGSELAVIWPDLETEFNKMGSGAQGIITNYQVGDPTVEGPELDHTISLYDYVIAKYNLDNFANRTNLTFGYNPGLSNGFITNLDESTSVTLIIVVCSSISVLSLSGLLLILKKKKKISK